MMLLKCLLVLVCLGTVWAQTEQLPTETPEVDEVEVEEAETEETQPEETTDTPVPPPVTPAVPSTCVQQVAELLGQIDAAASQSSQQIAAASAALENNIASSRGAVKALLESLDNKARQVVSEKTELCKAELSSALAELNEGGLGPCYEAQSLDIQSQAAQISDLKGEASQICDICAEEAGLDDCAQSNISNLAEKVKDLQAEIAAQIENVQNEANQCAENAKNGATTTIEGASANFDVCIQGA